MLVTTSAGGDGIVAGGNTAAGGDSVVAVGASTLAGGDGTVADVDCCASFDLVSISPKFWK